MPRNKKGRIRTPPVTAVLNAAELSSGFLAFPSGECQHKRLQALRPRLTPGLPKFSVLRDVPGCWYYPTQSGMQKVSFGGGALIFPPGHPALALALFYQIWPCPCKCPNGHKNGICVCFYPKSAISCRDCPMNPPKSLCTPPAKSYKFVSANPCKTDAGRINKYDYPGCVGGSFWNFIRFRDFPETLQNLSVSLPLDSSPEKGSPWQRGFVFDETDLRLLKNVPDCQSLSLWERCLRSRRRGQGCCQRARHTAIRTLLVRAIVSQRRWSNFTGLALSGADAPAPPKWEPLAKRFRFR